VWAIENPDRWHPGIVIDVIPFAVRAVFCSGQEPNARHKGYTVTLTGAPFEKPTYVYLRIVKTLDLRFLPPSNSMGSLDPADLAVVVDEYLRLKRAQLL
jgi:hypothetical protein